jgi:hypothetical protein
MREVARSGFLDSKAGPIGNSSRRQKVARSGFLDAKVGPIGNSSRQQKVARSAGDLEQLTFGYGKLDETLDFCRTKTVSDFNTAAADQFQDLLHQKIRAGTQDLRIAAITLSINNLNLIIGFIVGFA